MSLVKKFATVASGTLMSRIFGFTREMFMAAALGTGPVADAFNAAFRFPNTFRRLFAEGAFNSAFVPLFAKEIEKNGMDGARRFSEEVFGVLFTVLLFITIVMELSMPFIVRTVIAPGFMDDPVKFDNTVRLATIMFPYLACMSLAAMMGGMLNSLHRYFAAAIAPVFLNIILIGVLALAWWRGYDALAVGYGLSWGVMAAGLVQLAIVWLAVRNAGIKIGFRRPRLTSNVKRLLVLALPAAITGGITQINLLINTNIASGMEGAVSSLVYADRIYQLPLGVVGIAVATVLLPELSRALRGGHMKEASNLQNRSVEFTLFLTLPAAAALLVMSEPIVRLLFERGKFSPDRGFQHSGDLRSRPTRFRADQGVHSGLLCPRGYAHADDLRGHFRCCERVACRHAVPAPRPDRHRHGRNRGWLGQCRSAVCNAGEARPLGAGYSTSDPHPAPVDRGRCNGIRHSLCHRPFRL
jgi:putative peptidoglycan lipid II flippase